MKQQVCSLLVCSCSANIQKEWLQLMFVCGYTAPPAGVMYNNMVFLFFFKDFILF